MEFIEAPTFTKLLSSYMDDGEYRGLQHALLLNPEAGDLIQGTGGFRKIRWADPRRGKGKRGGLRVIYFFFPEEKQIWLLTLYGKDEADDLSSNQKHALKSAIEEETRARTKKRNEK